MFILDSSLIDEVAFEVRYGHLTAQEALKVIEDERIKVIIEIAYRQVYELYGDF